MPARLEELTPGAVVRGVAHDRPVRIAGVEWIGDGAVSLTLHAGGKHPAGDDARLPLARN